MHAVARHVALRPLLLPAAVAANALAALAIIRVSPAAALAVAVLPAVALLLGRLTASDRAILFAFALGISMSIRPLVLPLSFSGGAHLYPADIIALLAPASWLAARYLRPPDERPSSPLASPLIGWPLLLFGVAVLVAAVRGHIAYGTSLIGQPTRLVLYAGIVFALVDLDAARAYRIVVAVFYGGTVWMTLNALYYLATGGHQTDQIDLSTGGQRVLALGTAMYMGVALVLALLNLALDEPLRRRLLHLTIAALALFDVVLAFGRTTFVALVIALPLTFLLLRATRRNALILAPIWVPPILIVALLVPRVVPTLVPTFEARVTASPTTDQNFLWRQAASSAVMAEAHSSPVVGVGFGKQASFFFNGIEQTVDQDAHDSYAYLYAGGGLVTLAAFCLLVLVHVGHAITRFRASRDERTRVLLVWGSLGLLVFLVNAATGPVLSDAPSVLTIWTLLLLPVVASPRVRPRPDAPPRLRPLRSPAGAAPAAPRRRAGATART
jgi:hypothetical protein